MNKTAFILLIAIASIGQAGIRYKVTDLSELAEDSDIIPSVGYCINNSGDVAGHGMPIESGSSSKPFLYDAASGTFINLGNLADNFFDGKGGNGYAINEKGQVVGRNSVSNVNWNYRPFLFTDSNHNNFVDNGEMVNLTIDDDFEFGWAEDINNNGQIVGFSRDINGVYHGWVWSDLNNNNIPEAGEKQFFCDYHPNSINDGGEIVLNMGLDAYLWSDSDSDGVYEQDELQIMPLPQGYFDEALQFDVTIQDISPVSINNSRAICGAAENYFGKANGFYWRDINSNGLVETDEYTLFGSTLRQTHLRAMNNKSQIVGGTYEYHSSNRSAFIWSEKNGIQDLNQLTDEYQGTDGPRWFSQAEGINDKGQVVTTGWFDSDGNGKKGSGDLEHVFVLTPYLTGDISGDNKADLTDLNLISKYYEINATVCPSVDVNEDGTIDINDVYKVMEDWLIDLN